MRIDSLGELSKIAKAIDAELYEAIACVETLKPIVYDKEMADRFSNTYSAHILNYLQRGIHRDGISCVWRLWDADKDSNSIPALMRRLLDKKVISAIKDRRRNAMLEIKKHPGLLMEMGISPEERKEMIDQMAQESAEKAVQGVDVEIEAINSLIDDEVLKGLLERSKAWRNRHVAHNTDLTKKERKTNSMTDPVKWGELENIIERTGEVVVLLMPLADSVSSSPESRSEIYKTYADAFWGGLKGDLK